MAFNFFANVGAINFHGVEQTLLATDTPVGERLQLVPCLV
jgi:hypothetical protein